MLHAFSQIQLYLNVESPNLQCSQGESIYLYAVDLTILFLKGILGMCLMVGRSQDDMTDSRQPLSFAEHFEFYHFFFFWLTLSVDPATIHPVK